MAPADGPQHVRHWSDVPARRRTNGVLDARWADLGTLVGTVGLGAQRISMAAGKMPTPPHVHDAAEEIFWVLGGSGLSWQDGATYAIGAGDVLVHLAGGPAHTLRAGPEGLDVIAFGTRVDVGIGYLPRAGVAWVGAGAWAAVSEGASPWERERQAGDLPFGEPAPRPAGIVDSRDVAPREVAFGRIRRTERNLGQAACSARSGLRHFEVPPHARATPPHCHSADEELFVVLAGSGAVEIGDGSTPVEAGSVVGRPPGSGQAHSFTAGPDGLTLLAYGTRVPDDTIWYPRSRKIAFRGLGVIGRVELLDGYFDGEDEDWPRTT